MEVNEVQDKKVKMDKLTIIAMWSRLSNIDLVAEYPGTIQAQDHVKPHK
jgi:hypothetical protein